MFESNTGSLDNVALFSENNMILQQILSNIEKNNDTLSDNKDLSSMEKSLNHIDKRLLGSLKNKSNILLENLVTVNSSMLNSLNILGEKILLKSNLLNQKNQDYQDEINNNRSKLEETISDIPLILSDQLDALIGLESITKKAFDAQLDLLYKARYRGKNVGGAGEDKSELDALKDESKRLKYLNDIEDEKERSKKKNNNILSSNGLQNLLGDVVSTIGNGLVDVLSSPVTWTVGATIFAGYMATKLQNKLDEGSDFFEKTISDYDEKLKDTKFKDAVKQADEGGIFKKTMSYIASLAPESLKKTKMYKDGKVVEVENKPLGLRAFRGKELEDKMTIFALQNATTNLEKLNTEIKTIKEKQSSGQKLTDDENKALLSESSVRKLWESTILERTTKLKNSNIDISENESKYIEALGISNFGNNSIQAIQKKYGKSLYDSNDEKFVNSLAKAVASGLSEAGFKSVYDVAGGQKVGGTEIGLKNTSEITDNLNQFSNIITKIEGLAKQTELSQDEKIALSNSINLLTTQYGGTDTLTKLAQRLPASQAKNQIIQESTEQVTPRAMGGDIPNKGTVIVGENNPEFIKNNKVISPIGKTNQTNRTTIEKTIKDTISTNINNINKDVVESNDNIRDQIKSTNILLSNLISIMSNKSNNNNKQSNMINNIINNSNGNKQANISNRNNNPYIDKYRLT